MPLKHLLVLTLLLLAALTVSAQPQTADPLMTYAYRDAAVFAGPGASHRVRANLPPNVTVAIRARNAVGDWLRVESPDGRIAGWVMTGFLKLNPALGFSSVPVDRSVPDGDPSTQDSQAMKTLYSVPVIPTLSEGLRRIYSLGQALGLDSAAVTKVGDSLSADPLYLQPWSLPDTDFGPYDYLRDSAAYFGPSLALESAAARTGMATYVIFDPMWADKRLCQPNESPLACEYRLKKPFAAFILFGPNDVRHTTVERYTEAMRQIITFSLSQAVIPVVSTFSAHPEREFWQQALAFNVALVGLAEEYQIPLINLWAAARPLPDYGLDIDGVHMMHSGFKFLKFSTGHESWYGSSLRNLLALKLLDDLRHFVILGEDQP